jgi:hypothetical protein
MPLLNISLTRFNVADIWFPVNFNALQTKPMERVTASIGSDNGYIRLNDGLCGSWDKSSAGVQHSPKVTNGNSPSVTGEVIMAAVITRGNETATQSTLTYNIETATSNVFPIEIQFYVDNGGIDTELDALDTYYETKVITAMTTNQFVSMFTPKDEDVIMIIKTSMGCFDHIKFVENIVHIVLPVSVTSFNAEKMKTQNLVKWSISGNENIDKIILEKNVGNSFTEAAFIPGTKKSGSENYAFADNAMNNVERYRLKLHHTNGSISYSAIIEIAAMQYKQLDAKLAGNPVKDRFNIQLWIEDPVNPVTIRLVDQSGKLIYQKTGNYASGVQTLQIGESSIPKGFYIIEITQDAYQKTLKALKL